MPVAPDIDEGGPTKEHSGSGTFSHIESNWPNRMMLILSGGATTNRGYPVAVGGHRATAVSTTTGTVERWREGERLEVPGAALGCGGVPGSRDILSVSHSALFTSPKQMRILSSECRCQGQRQAEFED